MEKHHKIIIGGVSTLTIIILLTNSIFLYILYGQLNLIYKELNKEISDLQTDTQSKINELSTVILETKSEIFTINKSLKTEITQLKASTSSDFSGIIEDSVKSVVTIKTDTGQGTGFLITDDGYLVTNYHVIKDATAATVYTYDGADHQVSMAGYDPNFDVALLKISGSYNKLNLGDSDLIQIGEKVIAIGNPLGLQFSVSEGIISASNRAGPTGIEAYIQTDAALNPGNSGGPLINKNGKAIGINNFKIGSGENLGFALESNILKESINAISKKYSNQTLI